METETHNQELLDFFKALANTDRLRIAGLLALGSTTPAEIARRLNLPLMETLRHLGHLQHLGLIHAGETGTLQDLTSNAALALDTAALEAMSKRILSGTRPRFAAGEQAGDEFDRKVLRDFMTADGALKALPTQEKKLVVVLRHVAQAFEPERRYPEKEVNAILKRFTPDTSSLRRYLVDHKLLAREQGVYWRI